MASREEQTLVSKGISERFDENERDTAPRGYPRNVEDTKQTTKMRAVDVDAMLRTESGTRPALRLSPPALGPEDTFEEDPHSRPTIDIGIFPERMTPPAPPVPLAPLVGPTARRSPVWIALFVLLGVACFAAAAGSIGFVLGRISHR